MSDSEDEKDYMHRKKDVDISSVIQKEVNREVSQILKRKAKAHATLG